MPANPVHFQKKSADAVPDRADRAEFTEGGAWADVGEGWRHLHGSFRELGYSLEWHDFTPERDFDWSRSFHPEGVEICLNLSGTGTVRADDSRLDFAPLTAGFYLQGSSRSSQSQLSGLRTGGERHQFITVELSSRFLERHLMPVEATHHARLRDFLDGKINCGVSEPIRLTSEHQHMMMSLRRPPVYAAAHRLWYHAKALEVAAALLYRPSPKDDLFCQRQKGANHERVQKVIAILKENLAEPPSLEEIGRRVGCSHFYLSRIFSQEIGKPIFHYLRDLRMDRAAELLRGKKLNITQVALEVGYSSPSHFSTAFHEAFGCCPGLYPLATSSQRGVKTRGQSGGRK